MCKLPDTKEEIKASLARNGMIGLKACAIFLTGVGRQGTWDGILVTKEDMMRIRPTIVEILYDLKTQEMKNMNYRNVNHDVNLRSCVCPYCNKTMTECKCDW